MNKKRFEVTLYTDGACKNNGHEHAIGAWAYVLEYKLDTGQPHRKSDKGWFSGVTNQAMELQAVIEGIRALKHPCDVKVVTDSKYVFNVATTIREFAERNWHTKSGERMANFDGWQALISLCKLGGHNIVRFEHVKGHAGHVFNEECDRLCNEAAAEGKAELARVQLTAFGQTIPT